MNGFREISRPDSDYPKERDDPERIGDLGDRPFPKLEDREPIFGKPTDSRPPILHDAFESAFKLFGFTSDKSDSTDSEKADSDSPESDDYSKYLDKGEGGKYYDKETGKAYDSVAAWVKAQETLAKRYEATAQHYEDKAKKEWAKYKSAQEDGDTKAATEHYLNSQKYYSKAKECKEKAAKVRERIEGNNTISNSDVSAEAQDASKADGTAESDANDPNEKEQTKETRELTEEEKAYLKETLGWSDKKIAKCTIDEDGVIHYKTDREDLEGKESENGVKYERKTIEINGVKIEGVFPVFDSVFDTELDPADYKKSNYDDKCNAKLKEAIDRDPELRAKFTQAQLDQINNGETPDGYVWHHNEEPGKMQLVKREDHDRRIGGAAHTGGSALWGPDSGSEARRGEEFR